MKFSNFKHIIQIDNYSEQWDGVGKRIKEKSQGDWVYES